MSLAAERHEPGDWDPSRPSAPRPSGTASPGRSDRRPPRSAPTRVGRHDRAAPAEGTGRGTRRRMSSTAEAAGEAGGGRLDLRRAARPGRAGVARPDAAGAADHGERLEDRVVTCRRRGGRCSCRRSRSSAVPSPRSASASARAERPATTSRSYRAVLVAPLHHHLVHPTAALALDRAGRRGGPAARPTGRPRRPR